MPGTRETSSSEFQTTETSSRKSFLSRGIAILCAVAITAALMIGYAFLRWRHADRLRSETARQEQVPKPVPTPRVQLFIDEAMIKGSEALLGGTVQNISPDRLTGLTVELVLKRRGDGGTELRILSLSPGDLEPQQQGRYSLIVPSRQYRETRVQRIKSTRSTDDIAFKILPGTQRPAERLQPKETIVVAPPARRGKGEEFINTPDTPVKVP